MHRSQCNVALALLQRCTCTVAACVASSQQESCNHPRACSIALIAPLLSPQAQQSPKWISWKAHVRLVSFCMRNCFDARSDPDHLDMLINDFDSKFDAAYGTPYRKPKHHCIKHLTKYLRLLGPFRNFWCMGFEGFLQVSSK